MKNIKETLSSLLGDGALIRFVESIVGDKDIALILVCIILLVAIVSLISGLI